MVEFEATIVAVGDLVPVEQSGAWFRAVCDAYDGCEEDWDTLTTSLTEQAAQASFSSEVAETFVRVIEDQVSDRWTVFRRMAEERDYLLSQYTETLEQLAVEAAGASTEEVKPWDSANAAQWYE